ncbi:MAG: hypothetical protein ABIF10_00185 [Candidatus Woesearchaeota archaeon]
MSKNTDYEIKFWKDWLEAGPLEREKMVSKLPIIKSMWKTGKIPARHREQMLTAMLNSFFEDLESAVYTKIRIDKKRK